MEKNKLSYESLASLVQKLELDFIYSFLVYFSYFNMCNVAKIDQKL